MRLRRLVAAALCTVLLFGPGPCHEAQPAPNLTAERVDVLEYPQLNSRTDRKDVQIIA